MNFDHLDDTHVVRAFIVTHGYCKLKPFKPYSTLFITSYCALRRKDNLCTLARRFCVSRKGGTGGGGLGHPQGAVHMAAARLGCKRTMVGTRWANSHPGRKSRLRKRYSHLLGGSFLAGKTSWTPSGCLPTKSADYCMLVNEWAWFKVTSLLIKPESALGFVFGVRAQPEMKTWYVMCVC